MRYVITPTQFHNLVYGYLNKMFSKKDFRKDVIDDENWRVDMFDDKERELISYFWYEPGEYDDGTPHNGIGSLHVHPDVADFIRNTFSVRQGKALDIIGDWVSEKFDVDIDEIDIYPTRKSPPNY